MRRDIRTEDLIGDIAILYGFVDTMIFDGLLIDFFQDKECQKSEYNLKKAEIQYNLLMQQVSKLGKSIRKLEEYYQR